MHHHLSHLGLLAFAHAIGYQGIAALVYFETAIFLGFFLPGGSMLFAAGILASHGFFNIYALIVIAALASVLGDMTAYMFGRYVGVSFFERKDSRFFKRSYLVRAKTFYEAHGLQAILIARFIPIVRSFAPVIAGITRVDYALFAIYDVVGAILWVSCLALAGYFLGDRMPLVEQFSIPIIFVVMIVSLVPVVLEFRKKS